MTKQSFFGRRLDPRIFQIAIPMLLANLSTPLLGLVDTAILGHLDSAVYLGAAALGAQLVTLAFWSFGFLRMGTTGFVARSLGTGDLNEIKAILFRAIATAGIASLAILFLQQIGLAPVIHLMSDDLALSQIALTYSQIRIWSAPATLATYAMIGWLMGLQKARLAMGVMITVNLANIAFDYLFIVTWDLRAEGAAWASVISEYMGFFLAAFFTLKTMRQLGIALRPIPTLHWQGAMVFVTSSQHLFIRTLCLLFCFLYFAAQGAQLGEDTLAANAILLNLLAIAAYTMDGFAYATETLGGEAWGAKDRSRFRALVRQTWFCAMGIAASCTLILILGESWILALYTDIDSVLSSAQDHFLWLALLPLVAIHSYQLDGVFIGAGKTLAMRNAMLASCFLVFLPSWFFLQHLGNTGLWIAFWALHLARIVFLAPTFLSILRTEFPTSTV